MSNKLFKYGIFILLCMMFFYSCGSKDSSVNSSNNEIQQGDTTIEINALYINNINTGDYHHLQIRYNDVIASPINLILSFYLDGGQVKDVPITIPANYKSLGAYMNDNDYLNFWDNYGTTRDSIAGKTNVTFNPSWSIDSVVIKSATCPNKNYGFQVLDHVEWTAFYHPKDSITSISFYANSDFISYGDYDFATGQPFFHTNGNQYTFSFFDLTFQMISSTNNTYPLKQGMVIDIPFLRYYWNNRNYGSQGGAQQNINYSTLKLTITNVTNQLFDGTFSGKVYSSLQPDTLNITKGIFRNVPLPTSMQ